MDSGQACRSFSGSCSPIPGRDCFGDLPGDEIVVSPPSPIVEPLNGDGNDHEYGNGHEGSNGSENWSGNGDENREESGWGREPGNFGTGNRGGSDDVRGGPTLTSNPQPEPQDPAPQRHRRIMRRTRAQGRETRDRVGEGGSEAKKRTKSHKRYRRDVGNWGDLGGRRKKRGQKVISSVDVDPKDLENRKEARREAQGAQGISENCIDNVSPFSSLIRGFS